MTGATRGIGFALVEQLSTRPDTVVYAGTRSLPLPNASQLAQLAAKHPEVVIPIKINSADEADNVAAAEVIKAKYGYVSVVIANAGRSSLSPIPSLTLTSQGICFLTEFRNELTRRLTLRHPTHLRITASPHALRLRNECTRASRFVQ